MSARRLRAIQSINRVPVRRGHDHARAVTILEELRASMVIGMRMRDDGVADRRPIEAQLLQPTGDLSSTE